MDIVVKAKKRDSLGTGASRRLRRSGHVPGIVYGGGKDAVSLVFDHKDLFLQFRNEAFHASILKLDVEGKKESVLLRDYQLHPVRNTLVHIDFQRVSATEKVHMKVPLHFINEDIAPGIKIGGGLVTRIMTEVDVSCMAKDLPESIVVDMAELDVGQTIHLSQLKLPEGVEFVQLVHGDDSPVVSIAKPRGGGSSATAEEGAAEEAESTPEAE
jgi:large subunit ribosomal protein L25